MKKTIAVLLALAVLCLFTSCLSAGEDVGPTERSGMPSLGLGASSDDFHGTAETTGLTDADMKAIIKNYDKIMDELEAYGEGFDEDEYLEADYGYDEYNKALDDIFAKYGVSGPNQYNKFVMSYYCYTVLEYKAEMKADFTTALTLKAAGYDPASAYAGLINDDDYAVVKANYKGYKNAIENY